ncbi:hypothetical protein O3W44_23735 [Pantoea sp. LMR881]|uniref:hypothetical protein n=1 Tax=Pantoea sp. LMR881 TaxID=3014336 RepID=UPI0022AEEE03|nr:hypothetical protein [Pantoea sp. LMR881]MCZ4061506.1 hypothetical protein [Pantoea sp. LMR881]
MQHLAGAGLFILYLVAWLLLAMQILFIPEPSAEHSKPASVQGENIAIEGAGKLKIVYFAAAFSMICFFTGVIIIPQHFHKMSIGAAETGYFLSFISLVAVFAAALMPRIVARIGEYSTLYAAFICYTCAHLLFSAASGIPLLLQVGY